MGPAPQFTLALLEIYHFLMDSVLLLFPFHLFPDSIVHWEHPHRSGLFWHPRSRQLIRLTHS